MDREEVKEAVLQSHSLAASLKAYVAGFIERSEREFREVFFLSLSPVASGLSEGIYDEKRRFFIDQILKELSPTSALYWKVLPTLDGYGYKIKTKEFLVSHGGHIHMAVKSIDLVQVIGGPGSMERLMTDTENYRMTKEGYQVLNPGIIVKYMTTMVNLWKSFNEDKLIASDILVKLYMNKSVFALPGTLGPDDYGHEYEEPSGKRLEYELDIEFVTTLPHLKDGQALKYLADKFWNAYGLKACGWL